MSGQAFLIGDRAYWYEWNHVNGRVGVYANDGVENSIFVCENPYAPLAYQYAVVTVDENDIGSLEITYGDSEAAWRHAEQLFMVRTAENSTMGNDNLRERNELVAFLRQQMNKDFSGEAECSLSSEAAQAWANGKESAFADVLRWLGESVD